MQNDDLKNIGLLYHAGAFSDAEQADLVEAIELEGRWEKDYDRRAQRHGHQYLYESKTVVRLFPMAAWMQAWVDKIWTQGWMTKQPDQVTVQWYEPGTGIGDHCDDRRCFGPEIATISLLASCTYRFINPQSGELHTQLLDPGSIVVLSGDARNRWKHGISKAKASRIASKRLSVTFRTVSPSRVRAVSDHD